MEKNEVYSLLEKHYRTRAFEMAKRISRHLNSLHRSEDVVQEAYARAFQYWNTLRSSEELDSWFSGILNNCMKDNYKEENQHGMLNYKEVPEQVEKASAIPKIIRKEVEALIEKEEGNGPNILRMFLIEGYRPKEITQVIGTSPGAIRQIVFRFRETIREKYKWKI